MNYYSALSCWRDRDGNGSPQPNCGVLLERGEGHMTEGAGQERGKKHHPDGYYNFLYLLIFFFLLTSPSLLKDMNQQADEETYRARSGESMELPYLSQVCLPPQFPRVDPMTSL